MTDVPTSNPDLALAWKTYLLNVAGSSGIPAARKAFIAAWHARGAVQTTAHPDTARLDWLGISMFQDNPRVEWSGFGITRGRTIREQIDHQMGDVPPVETSEPRRYTRQMIEDAARQAKEEQPIFEAARVAQEKATCDCPPDCQGSDNTAKVCRAEQSANRIQEKCDVCGAIEGRHYSDCILVLPRPATYEAVTEHMRTLGRQGYVCVCFPDRPRQCAEIELKTGRPPANCYRHIKAPDGQTCRCGAFRWRGGMLSITDQNARDHRLDECKELKVSQEPLKP